MTPPRARALALALPLTLALSLSAARAQESWLDAPLARWNQPGQPVPQAPPGHLDLALPQCLQFNRPPQTPEDQALVAVGWTPYGPFSGAWGAMLVEAISDYDGMCRPLGYNYIVFVDGAFAGTISPEPMAARTDGAAQEVRFGPSGELTARFVRYAPTDALCCPSRPAVLVRYRIDRTADGPVLVPEARDTVESR